MPNQLPDNSHPRAGGVKPRHEHVRESNDRVAQAAVRLRFFSRVPFLCECNDPSCNELVLLRLDEYDQVRPAPMTAPGHSGSRR
jgi:hypothetical protein